MIKGSRIHAMILAGGKSERMGQSKLLLSWREKPLICYVLEVATSIPFAGTSIVLPKHDKAFDMIIASYDCQPIYNDAPQLGMGYSLARGIQSLPSSAEATLVLLGDQPRMRSEDIQKVVHTFDRLRAEYHSCPKAIIRVKYNDGRIGHPVLFSHHFFAELARLTGDIGGKQIITQHSRHSILCESENDEPKDVDTVQDYERLLQSER